MANPTVELVNCPHCQALADARVANCWLCGERIEAPPNARWARPVAPQQDAERAIGQSNVAIIVVLAAIVVGTMLIAPGLGIPLCVLAVPVLIRRGRGQSWLRSIFAGLATAVMVVFAIVAAFFVVCLSLASQSGNPFR